MKSSDALGLTTGIGQVLVALSIMIPWDGQSSTAVDWLLVTGSILATLLGFWRWTRFAYVANVPIVALLLVNAVGSIVAVALLAVALAAFILGSYLMFGRGARFPGWFEVFLPG